MLEPALAAVLEASHAGAGALCLFDQRHELLRLAAEVGLSDEGCKRLRQVRRGGMGGWDMPLHSLLNRRVYLIESAAKNRYVPPLVEAAASVTTVACVPLYAGATPVASIILVAVAPHRITEQQIGPLSEPLRELARMIEAARRRTATEAPPATQPLAVVRPAAAERDESEASRVQTLVTSLAEAERERARLAAALEAVAERAERARAALARAEAAVEALEDEKQRARDEIGKLREGAGTLLSERGRLEQGLEEARLRDVEARTQVAELERQIGALREQRQADAAERAAQLEQLRTRLAEAEAAAANGSAQVGEWERERDLLAAELHEAAVGEQRAQEELRAATERAAAATEADLQRALATARAAEDACTAANADAEAARRALEDERQRARDEIARLEGIAAERDRVSMALAAVQAERDYFAAEEAAADV